ncbi:MAG: DNRLRE domain-containing protein, partial [Actinobacteria bacterium]|nr:DNRLRE domain-containing protein [Actinomycetota bacterium]
MAAVALLASGITVAALPGGSPGAGSGALPPGSRGSLAHHSWWDPRGWFGGSTPDALKPKTIAAGGGPQRTLMPHQAKAGPVRRVKELTGRRTANSRVYRLSDGRLQADISAGPVNYRDRSGRWQPINTTVQPSSRHGYKYANTTNTFGSFFGTTAGHLVRFDVPGGGWLTMGVAGSQSGAGATTSAVSATPMSSPSPDPSGTPSPSVSATSSPSPSPTPSASASPSGPAGGTPGPGSGTGSGAGSGTRPVSMRVAGSTVSYSGAVPGARLSYQVTPDALKEGIILSSPSAASSYSYTITVGGGLVPYRMRDGQIAFSRGGAGGPPAVILPKPFMTSAASDASSPYGKVWSPRVTQRAAWDPARHVLRLTVTPDAGWLRAPGRAFPVTVDPTVEIAPTPTDAQNTMIESDTPSTNYNDNWRLSVGTTATAKVRALLKFPLTGIPSGTQIDSADLRMYYDQEFGNGSAAQTLEAHQASASWSASTATWSNASSNVGAEGLNEVIVDNTATSSTSSTGNWPSASDSNANGGSYQYNQDTSPGDSFTWVPDLGEAGDYFVAEHYVASSAAAANAPVTVHYNGGTGNYTVNQQSGTGGVWGVLDQLPFAAGTAGSVVAGDGPATGSTRVEADAVRFRKWGTAVVDPNTANVWDSFSVRNIVQGWLDQSSANNGFVVKTADESTLNQGGPRYEASRFAYQGETATYPQLVVTYGRPAVTLDQITTIHATGADLAWTPYTDPTPGTNPNDDLVEYQVHRSVDQVFTPSASTLVAPVASGTTSFTDTSAPPTPPGQTPNAFYYMVAAKTADGKLVKGPTELVRLPNAGYTTKIINSNGATTLSEAQPTTNEQHLSGQPWLATGDNSATYGVTRTVVKYPTMATAGIPATATVTDAELKLWGWFNSNTGGGSATYDAHALTQDFTAGGASWNNASSGTPWTTAGGTYDATVTGSNTGLTNDPNRQLWPVTSTVQGWVTTPASEHGLLLRAHSESGGPQELELWLDTSAQEHALRPELVVTYTDTTPEDTYYAPQLPEPMSSATSYTVPVTLTNTTSGTWAKADWVLSYHWLLPDGTDISDSSNQQQTPLAADMAPGSVATVNAAVKTPDSTGSGGDRTGYQLAWDLYDKTTGTWLSSGTGTPITQTVSATPLGATRLGKSAGAGASQPSAAPMAQGNNTVAVLKQAASVEQPSSDKLGLEKFYQYTGVNTGAGSALLTNAYAGNTVWSYNAFSNPSRGFATFVRLAYNSMDTSDAAMGFGWSLQTSTLMRLGTPLDFLPNPNPTTVKLTDGDGTSHLFTYNSSSGQWLSPPGVHFYLQQPGTCDPSGKTQNDRAWLLTAPDRTQFWYDCQGYQTAVIDKNGNEADFTYSQRNSNNKPIKFLDYITDPSGRQTLTLSYYQKGDDYQYIDDNGNVASGTNLTDPQIIDQVKSITDISGRTITFLYTT